MIRGGLKNILQFMCHNLLLWKILKLLPDQIVKANDTAVDKFLNIFDAMKVHKN